MKLDNRTILSDGTVILSEQGLFELIYQELPIDELTTEKTSDTQLYNETIKLLDSDFKQLILTDKELYEDYLWDQDWPTPDEYKSIDLKKHLIDKCSTAEEIQRIEEEWILYEKNALIPMLYHLLFLIDNWRSQNVVWGVGRGSSVGSFILYKLGLNRINPLEYDLSIQDFLT
jgi:DNA polymerase III alpha subunit